MTGWTDTDAVVVVVVVVRVIDVETKVSVDVAVLESELDPLCNTALGRRTYITGVVVLTVVVTTGIDRYEEQKGLATAELPIRHRSKLS